MLKSIAATLIVFLIVLSAPAQEKWNLLKCVQYAKANNISVKQADLQTRFSDVTYGQSKSAQYPSLNFQNSTGYRFGRSENPATGVLEDNNFLSSSFSLQSGVTLFNWFVKRNTIESNKLASEADKAQVLKVQDDVALNVAVAYLQILLAREQANLTRVQIGTTVEQLNNTRKRVDAGVLPELNAAELEAQLSRDSSNLITAEASVTTFILQMKALLNLDAGAAFDIESPTIDKIFIENLADLQPEAVYALALQNLAQNKVIDLRLMAAKKDVDVAKGQMYPQITAFGGIGTSYVNVKRPVIGPGPDKATDAYVTIGPNAYNVFSPSFIQTGESRTPFGDQFNTNLSQNIGIGLNIPIFNGHSARANWERTKLQVRQWELTKELDNQTLKQNIYRAYNEATSSMQLYNSDKKTVQTSGKSYEYAQKRYDQNLLSTFDLLTSQNNYLRAQIQALYSQYDYIFKMKLLEFYKGQGIRL
ncbi:MAG TPA: TolC family protein [Chitinophagaceae bacterium]|nr:TolC family protein [Chitinophagaceae bacterium]